MKYGKYDVKLHRGKANIPYAVRVRIAGVEKAGRQNPSFVQGRENIPVTIAGVTAPSRKNEAVISRDMQMYIDEIKREAIHNPELARKKAKMALIRTGVLTPDGRPKKKIVTWE